MTRNITLHLPEKLSASEIKTRVETAIAENKTPKPVTKTTHKIGFYAGNALLEAIKTKAEELKRTDYAVLIAELCNTEETSAKETSAKETSAKETSAKETSAKGKVSKAKAPADTKGVVIQKRIQYKESQGTTIRNPYHTAFISNDQTKLQRYWLENTMHGVRNNAIVLAEGSTGIGKTALGLQIVKTLQKEKPDCQPWITTPSLVLISHFLTTAEKEKMLKACTVLLGRQQFVSTRRTKTILSKCLKEKVITKEEVIKILNWLETGECLTPYTKTLQKTDKKIGYLIEDLKFLCPDFPTGMVELSSHDDIREPAESIRKHLMQKISTAKWVLCTHNMFAALHRSQKKDDKSPGYTDLIIDEAHDFEDAFARIYGNELSIFKLKLLLKHHEDKSVQKLAKHATALMTSLQTYEGSLNDQSFTIRHLESIQIGIEEYNQTHNDVELKSILDDIKPIITQLKGKKKYYRFNVHYSPKLLYPSITIGPTNLAYVLIKVWNNCQSAVLISATLYLQKKTRENEQYQLTAEYIRFKHAIPKERLHTFAPAIGTWNYTIPTVYVPTEETAAELCYKYENPEPWQNAILTTVKPIFDSSLGGSLMLCTSKFDQAHFTSELLKIYKDRVVLTHGKKDTTIRKEFIEKVKAGIRPIWVGTGPAWVGLDLTEETHPKKDLILTDLVITRIPYNLKKSASHQGRKAIWGEYPVEIAEALIRTKHGIGRLIRSTTGNHKNLHFLDGRLFLPPRPKNTLWRNFRFLLTPYNKTETLKTSKKKFKK
jgi:Rad3-related DNA helicase